MAGKLDVTEIAHAAPGPPNRRDELIARIERLPFSRFHLRLGAMLGVGTFFDAFDAISIGVALTVVFTSLHIGFMNAGLLISGGYVGQFFGAWFFGYASEIYGRKRAFVAAIGLFGLLSIATAFAWSFQSLLILRLLQGFGLGGEVPVASAMFNEYMRGPTRGRIALFYETIFIVGGILVPSIGLLLFAVFGNELGWRALFLVGGLPALHAVYAWFRLPESARWLADHGRYDEADRIIKRIEAEPRRTPLPPPHVRALPRPLPTRVTELFGGIYLRRTAVLWVQAAATFFVVRIPSVWLPTLYVKIGGLPVDRALMLATVSYVVILLSMFTQALVLDTIGRKPTFVFGFAMVAVAGLYGALSIHWFHVTSWQTLFAAATLMNIGTAVNSSAGYNYAAELYPTRMRGLGVATSSSMNRLASIISPTLVGALLAWGFGLESVFAMVAVVGVIGAFVLAILGVETKQRVLEELSP